MAWTPFLVTLFFFIFMGNLFEVIPVIQFPVNARMALPAFMALLVWAIFNVVGIKNQGFFGYVKSVVAPPGVPKFLLPLVALIEFVSTIFVRPFSLAVRLFANMVADHVILLVFVGFIFLASGIFLVIMVPVAMVLEIVFFMFAMFVAFIQAVIFAFLSTLYINDALHPGH
jgi:F-type H+-transporting ATPase subunit a